MKKSALQKARATYQPKLPIVLTGPVKAIAGKPTESVANQAEIKALFPSTYGLPELKFEKNTAPTAGRPVNVGVILSGGQAPGGHNVISGLFDGIKKIHRDSRLFGFIMGPGGLVDHNYMELTAPIGGDDSNTNAAVLAEYYKDIDAGVQVIGCPKTIDGDLKNDLIETSFGFDTATKVYSEVIGNIQRDCNSAKKYWHFIKLMGRSASHIALECALQCQPNVCIISEEVEAKNMTLQNVVNNIAQIVANRAAEGNNFGTVLIPEGLIEFIPAVKNLIAELNDFLAKNADEFAKVEKSAQRQYIIDHLSKDNAETYASLPKGVARQLTLDRDPHGNVQVSLIETEKLLSEMVGKRLAEMKAEGKYNGKFSALHHFFGYEGRCADPSNFDADYCYALGFNAACLIQSGVTGYMSSVRNLVKPSVQWQCGGIPITMMMNMERRHGEMKPVIQKALVRLDGAPFQKFASQRDEWALNTCYIYPGPIQYFGPAEVCDQPSLTLQYEHKSK